MVKPNRCRWYQALVASAGILLVYLVFDYLPLLNDIKELRWQLSKAERSLAAMPRVTAQLTSANDVRDKTVTIAMQSPQIEGLFLLAHRYGVSIRALNVLNKKTVNLRGSGEFSRWADFVAQLDVQLKNLALTDFSYDLDANNHLVAKLTISLASSHANASRPTFPEALNTIPRNPFCGGGEVSMFKRPSRQMQLTRFALDQMNQSGYLHQGRRHRAIVSLPTGETLDIGVGDVLGKEGGKVEAITAQRVMIRLPMNKVVYLRRF